MPGRGDMAATCSRTITTAISATRARICRRSPRSRPIARSISGRSPSRSAADCARLHGRARTDRRRGAQSEKCLLNNGNPWLEQATLADFMPDRQLCRASAAAPRALQGKPRLPRWTRCVAISATSRSRATSGGLHARLVSAAGIPDAVTVEATGAAREASASIRCAAAGVHVRAPTALTGRAILLGYAALSRKQIEKGIARLSDAIDDAIDDPATDMTAYFSQQSAAAAALPHSPRNPSPRMLAPRLRQQPALRRASPPRALSAQITARQGSAPMPVLKNIYRYPIKGLSAQPLARVELEARQAVPARPHLRAGAARRALRHHRSQMGQEGAVRHADARRSIGAGADHAGCRDACSSTIAQDNHQLLIADLSDAAARAKVEEFFWQLVPALRSAPTLVRARDGHFMDKPDNVISLINLATVRSLEEQWGYKIDPLRFRANFYIDGAKPWEEFEWVGSDIRIGDVAVSASTGATADAAPPTSTPKPAAATSICRLAACRLRAQGTRRLSCCARGGAGGRRRYRVRSHDDRWHQRGATARPSSPCGPPTLYLRRMLFHLRPLRRIAGPIDPGGYVVQQHSVELAMPGLRHRQDNVSSSCRNPAQADRGLRRATGFSACLAAARLAAPAAR